MQASQSPYTKGLSSSVPYPGPCKNGRQASLEDGGLVQRVPIMVFIYSAMLGKVELNLTISMSFAGHKLTSGQLGMFIFLKMWL